MVRSSVFNSTRIYFVVLILGMNLFAVFLASLVLPDPGIVQRSAYSRTNTRHVALNLAVGKYQESKGAILSSDGQQLGQRNHREAATAAEEKDPTAASDIKRIATATLPTPSEWPPRTLGEFEPFRHPALTHYTLQVPKFWSRPIHQNGLMTKSLTDQVGHHVHDKNNDGEPQPTIFLALASYRDYQCRQTIESAYSRAAHPERIRVGVVDQIRLNVDPPCTLPEYPCHQDPTQMHCLYSHLIHNYTLSDGLSVGPVLARHLAHRLYRGEYYAMQCDSHVTFVQDWDTDAIAQFQATGNEMAVLTNYMSDVQESITPDGKAIRRTRAIMCNTDFEFGVQGTILRHGQQRECTPTGIFLNATPQLQPYWAAGMSFARGHFLINVPYDPYLPNIFQGEEMSIGLRSFTIGYDCYAPMASFVFHHYAIGNNRKARDIPHYWEHQTNYSGIGKISMRRLLGVLGMNTINKAGPWNRNELDYYGIGKVRTTHKFFETFGIYPRNQTTEHHLCKFVESGEMHMQFSQYIRKDKMGIDYSAIHYRFKDPTPKK